MNKVRTSARQLLSDYVELPVASVLANLGISPNAVTLAGLIGAGISAYIIATGNLWAGGIVMLVAGILDLFDGALARATGRTSRFGALLDSVVDRLSEIVLLLGLLIFYLNGSSSNGVILVYLAVTASIMVSYLRARSEGLGIENRGGIMTRPERVALMGIGLIVARWYPSFLMVVLGLIAVLALFTTGQRLFYTWRGLRDEESQS